jgi:hypothetical protein
LDRAIADYEAALRINPQFDQAAENLAAVRVKRDRRNAVNSDNLLPSFDCKKATRAVEKAICSDLICPGSIAKWTPLTRPRLPISPAGQPSG